MKYNHAFDIAFSVEHSIDPNADDVSPQQLREAIQRRIDTLDDDELLEAVGAPFDSYEEE